MHISEGIIDIGPCLAGYGGTALLLAWGLKKTDKEKIPLTALMGAAFFAASLIHFRIGITSVHLTLLGLTTLVLGLSAIPAIVAGLLFQAIMFQHGGITTLGINSLIMLIPSVLGYFLFRGLSKKKREDKTYLTILSGIVSSCILLGATVLAALIILANGEEFRGIATFFTIGNLILAAVEGVISAFIINRILKIKPEMIKLWN